uniref:RING-type E3 ubiquitin transferase n=1 Tax=Strix occidentalis caurina TaxID=311401 RepID=A0A8D0FWJ0_STROC
CHVTVRWSVTEWSCPICGETRDGAAYVTPCLHKFCLGCIVRWAKRKASCPLCRQTVRSIVYSVRSEEDCLEMTFRQRPSHPSVAGHQDEQQAADSVPVGGFLERSWVVDLAQADIIATSVPLRPGREGLGEGAVDLPAAPDSDVCAPAGRCRGRAVQGVLHAAAGAPGLPGCQGAGAQPRGHPWTLQPTSSHAAGDARVTRSP